MSLFNFSSTPSVKPSDFGACAASASAAGAVDTDGDGLSFGDLLDVVNPLQHIPVIDTLYRKLTGDQIKTVPKLVGDALYGGPMGFAGSLADTIYTKVTGHSFGDTVIALAGDVFGSHPSSSPSDPTMPPNTGLASATPNISATPATVAAASLDSIMVPGQDALMLALGRSGVSPETALRATDAYRRTVSVAAANNPLQPPALRASLLE